jgi:AcrR family transcriptional regulator
MSTAEVPTSPPTSSGSRVKGSEAVKTALIAAAADMLGEVGPKSLSVRDLAERAGVNHGQVHHYFGGKRGLLEAAMRHLAKQHFDHSLELSDGAAVPPPLSLTEDRPYFRALCQSVMDGDIELVMTVDRDDEISVPLRVLRHLRETHPESDDLDVRARFAALAAMQLGWFAFEELLFLISEVEPGDEDAFRDRVKTSMHRLIDLEID